ncbi:MAG: hypothetical protein M4579_002119 [Chaenotheca gracillima]|nr:MAG: hypothetical protein M4579_002119 [Chaenotheca gracillima]
MAVDKHDAQSTSMLVDDAEVKDLKAFGSVTASAASNARKKNKKTITAKVQIQTELNGNHLYRPGEAVTGTIDIQCPLEPAVCVMQLIIELSGRSKTKLVQSNGQSSSVFRDRRVLFTKRETLHNELDAGTLLLTDVGDRSVGSFPFSMTFPYTTDIDSRDVYKKRNSAGFVDDPHPLPPSLMRTQFGGILSNPKGYGEVQYELTARVMLCRPFDKANSLGCQGQLPLQLCSASPRPSSNLPEHDIESGDQSPPPYSSSGASIMDPQIIAKNSEVPPSYAVSRSKRHTYVCSSTLLLPHINRDLSFKERMRDRLSSATPQATFSILMDLPDVFVLTEGSVGPSIGFSFNRACSTCPEVPEVILRSFAIKIDAFTQLRAPSLFSTKYVNDKTSFHLCQRSNLSMPLPEGGRLDLASAIGVQLQQLPYAPKQPTFQSFCIRRHYGWKIKIEVECGGKRFTPSFEGVVSVLPPA